MTAISVAGHRTGRAVTGKGWRTLVISLVAWLVLGQSIGPVVFEPRPMEPRTSRLTLDRVTWRVKGLTGELRALSMRMLRRRLERMGVDAGQLDRSETRLILNELVSFSLRLENRGQETLYLNSDQILLMAKEAPVGVLVDMADFWPQSLPGSGRTQEEFARVFARGTIDLEPGESSEQLLIFRPTGRRFPRQLALTVNRMYYGIENLPIICHFAIRYPK